MADIRLLLNLLLLFVFLSQCTPSLAGELAVGTRSRINGGVKVPLYGASDLNYKSRVELVRQRRQLIQQLPLYSGTYSPDDYVFGQIEDGKPWWGMYGMYVYRVGQKSILGPAKESQFFFNPYLLIAAEPTCIGLIDPAKVSSKILSLPDFPFVWQPADLVWYPKECRASVTYDVSNYQAQINKYQKYLKGNYTINKFSLIGYNARDLGYDYIYPDIDKAVNVQNQFQEKRPIELKQMIHCGGSCGYPGGCNNMSPLMAELDFLILKSTPARLPIYMWKDRPSSVHEKPDFTFIINFK
ncbi:MAG: hypothetical protein K2W82_13055 [Candidatus Obscuribacterales bacterium]|nr:hypothetical protein [Candidatus Obscuribacterales bacterium]